MRFSSKLVVVTALLSVMLVGCKSNLSVRNRLNESHFPPIVLWAWERPEDLRGLDSKRFAVAFLAQTLVLKGDDVILNPRQQPLQVSVDTKLMAVTRIESAKTTGERAALSEAQKQKLVSLVMSTRQLANVSAIQISRKSSANSLLNKSRLSRISWIACAMFPKKLRVPSRFFRASFTTLCAKLLRAIPRNRLIFPRS